jgi:hypothetical protein
MGPSLRVLLSGLEEGDVVWRQVCGGDAGMSGSRGPARPVDRKTEKAARAANKEHIFLGMRSFWFCDNCRIIYLEVTYRIIIFFRVRLYYNQSI